MYRKFNTNPNLIGHPLVQPGMEALLVQEVMVRERKQKMIYNCVPDCPMRYMYLIRAKSSQLELLLTYNSHIEVVINNEITRFCVFIV